MSGRRSGYDLPVLGDQQDRIEKLLEQLVKNTSNINELDSGGGGTSQSYVSVHDIAGDFANPHNAFSVANETWENDKIKPIELADLGPGDTQTVAEVGSSESEIFVAVRAVATTEHPADVGGSGQPRSAVRYIHEYQTHEGSGWNPIMGMSSTIPMGYLGNPVEIIPGAFVGPMSRYRIRLHNRTDETANDVTISAGELGGQIVGMIIRGEQDNG